MTPSTALARAILDELVHQGVREVVLSPGSRSAPLAFEALRLARAGRIQLHVRVDERSAGFLALGLAKVSGDPVVVACTSGTAVANLAPAVVEASYSAVPIVVVTADRPVEARGVGSPQAIDQVEFFGGMVRHFADLGAQRRIDPADPDAAQRAARAAASTAVASALGVPVGAPTGGSRGGGPVHPASAVAHGGPVHLNVGFRLPLVPEEPDGSEPALPPHSPAHARRPPLSGCDHRDLAEVLGDVPARGVLLVGDLPATSLRGHQQWLVELAGACGWPIVAEPTAGLHGSPMSLAHGPLVTGAHAFLDAHRPDLVVSVGLWGLSRSTMELVRRARRHVAIELPTVGREVCDPLRTASQVLTSIPLPPARSRPALDWRETWLRADAVAAEVVGRRLAAAGLTGASTAARVWSSAPDDGLLLAAASWPVRQLEAFAGRRTGLRVVGNRGANGIDGLVSTAWGAALAHQAQGGGQALALLGDLAFLHDHNGLLVGDLEPRPDLVVVVVDNDGGGIFHQLEQGRAEYAGQFERLFATPLGRDLVAVADAAGVPATRVRDTLALEAALRAGMAAGGVHVVVAHVPERHAEASLLEDVRAEVAARLG